MSEQAAATTEERIEKLQGSRLRAQARRGRPLHARQGQLRGRHQAAGHGVRRLRPLPLRARPHRGHRQGCGARGAGGARGADRRGSETPEPALHADAGRGRAGGAGRREGAVPGPGGGLRHRRGPLRRRRRRRAGRGGVRGAARPHRRQPVDGRGCAGAARGHRGQDRGRPRRAPPPQPHLHLGGRRPGRGRAGPGERGGGGRGAGRLPAGASLSAGDLRLRRVDGQGQRQAHHLGHLPGAACGAHGGFAHHQHPRAQHPHRLTRHRRRLRQQGRGVSRLHLRRRGLDRAGPAGEVDRGPHGEPLRHRVRARLPHEREDRRDPRRPDHGPPMPRARRPRRIRRLRGPDEVPGRLLQHLHRLVRHPQRLRRGGRRLHQQGPGRRRLPLLLPGHRGVVLHRAHGRRARAQARHGPGRAAPAEPHRQGPGSPTPRRSAGSTTRATTTPRWTRRWPRWTTRPCGPSRRPAARRSSAARPAS